MTGDSVRYASFMIRLWRDPAEASGEEVPPWVGEIESVQTGQIVTFKGLEALADLLVGRLSESPDFCE